MIGKRIIYNYKKHDENLIANDIFHKMRRAFQTVVTTSLYVGFILMSACGDNGVQLPDQKLGGHINGQEWTNEFANAFLLSVNFQYIIRFLSSEELTTDPCTLPTPGLPNVKAIFKPLVGSYVVAPQAIADNQAQVAFEIPASKNLIATDGFIEIYTINSSLIHGYLQAVLDKDNTVEGYFQVKICN